MFCEMHFGVKSVFRETVIRHTKYSMPKVPRLRRRRVLKQPPSCLCNRSLGKSLSESLDFHVVSCSNRSCGRKILYLHQGCARFYLQTIRQCSLCKRKLVATAAAKGKNLAEVLRERTLSVHRHGKPRKGKKGGKLIARVSNARA